MSEETVDQGPRVMNHHFPQAGSYPWTGDDSFESGMVFRLGAAHVGAFSGLVLGRQIIPNQLLTHVLIHIRIFESSSLIERVESILILL